MTEAEELNARFGLARELVFGACDSGLLMAEISNGQATASLCLQGAQMLNWHPVATTHPVLWAPDGAVPQPGRPVHGGVPVCWPWFGQHAISGYPAHGFARNLPWEMVASSRLPDGSTRLHLRLPDTRQPVCGWEHELALELEVVVGERLNMVLTTTNTGKREVVIGEALHAYFHLGDITRCRVTGLDGVIYADKLADFARSRQQGDLVFSGETDRVYLDTMTTCIIEDAVLQRRIHVAKSGSRSTVVWTPWKEKAAGLPDFAPGDWRHMVCVESANALDYRVTVAAGATHVLAVEYAVEDGWHSPAIVE